MKKIEVVAAIVQDTDEIWWLETIGGHHWIARRVPDDVYVVMPNQLGLDEFDLEDALFYEDQFRHMRSGVKLIPVFTKVLYFGYHKRWTEPRSLSEQCRVPIEFADQFQDYRIEVVELAWLTDEEIDSLSGDLKVAAIFLRKLRLNEISEWPRLKIQHIDELLNLFTEITKQSEFQRMKSECAERKGEIMMCDVFENYKKDLISQGSDVYENEFKP